MKKSFHTTHIKVHKSVRMWARVIYRLSSANTEWLRSLKELWNKRKNDEWDGKKFGNGMVKQNKMEGRKLSTVYE
jgi:hypothetical protein